MEQINVIIGDDGTIESSTQNILDINSMDKMDIEMENVAIKFYDTSTVEIQSHEGDCIICGCELFENFADLEWFSSSTGLKILDLMNYFIINHIKQDYTFMNDKLCQDCYRCLMKANELNNKVKELVKQLNNIKEELQSKFTNTNCFKDKATEDVKLGQKSSVCLNEEDRKSNVTTLSCPICTDTMEESILCQHYEQQHNHTSFSCPICCTMFESMFTFIVHTKSEHSEYSVDDVLGLVEIPKESKMDITMVRFQCEKCDRNFKSDSLLQNHMVVIHEYSCKEYVCSFCGQKFKRESDRDEHCLDKHPIKLFEYDRYFNGDTGTYTCPICNKNVVKKHSWVRHIEETHYKKKPHQCPYCVQCYYIQSELRVHLKTAHRNLECFSEDANNAKAIDSITIRSESVCEDTGGTKQKYQCPHCAKFLSQPSALDLHILRKHSNIRRFPCPECSKSYVQKTQLEYHVSFCHPEATTELIKQGIINKTFKRKECPLCNRLYAHEFALKRHMACMHPDATKYPCKFCTQVYYVSDALNSHLKIKHRKPVNGVSEDNADDSAETNDIITDKLLDNISYDNKKSRYEQVLYSEDGTRTFSCLKCSKSFTNSKKYNSHLKSTHSLTKSYFDIIAKCKPDQIAFCPICSFEVQYSSLFQHINDDHTKEMIFTCKFCDILFNNEDVLAAHVC